MVASSGQTRRSGSHGSSRSRPMSSGDQRPRVQEPDARADPVVASRTDAEPVGQPLGQPALDAPGRDDDDLLGERVVERLGEEVGQRLRQQVGARSPVQVERHGPTLCAGADAPARPTGQAS